jgi:PEGA domain
MREGTYRLRVTHPRFGTEVRQIQVIAGQTTEVRLRLTPRAAASRR